MNEATTIYIKNHHWGIKAISNKHQTVVGYSPNSMQSISLVLSTYEVEVEIFPVSFSEFNMLKLTSFQNDFALFGSVQASCLDALVISATAYRNKEIHKIVQGCKAIMIVTTDSTNIYKNDKSVKA